MTKILIGALLVLLAGLILSLGCDKERIVQSTEYVHDIQQVVDTVFKVDTIFRSDSIVVQRVDTVKQVTQVHDTVRVNVIVHDTVVTTRTYHDTVTVVVTDTVVRTQCLPNTSLAIAALQSQTNPLVLDAINTELGIADGWILYLADEQMNVAKVSSNVYDIYGYIDFWLPDWSDYYPLEFYWRMTYVSGDPASPGNWQMTEPPAAVSGHQPGVRPMPKTALDQQIQR